MNKNTFEVKFKSWDTWLEETGDDLAKFELEVIVNGGKSPSFPVLLHMGNFMDYVEQTDPALYKYIEKPEEVVVKHILRFAEDIDSLAHNALKDQ